MVALNLHNPWVRRIISISFILIVAFCAYLLAQLTWKLIAQPSVSYSSSINLPKQVVKSNTGVSETTKASRIANVHIFGQFQAPKKEVVKEVAPVVVKKTPLKFVLMGTAFSLNARSGMASIKEGKVTNWFKVGDDVFDKATLYAVYEERVEFERDNGDIEVLELTKDKKNNFKDFIAPERGANLGAEFEYTQDTSANRTYTQSQSTTPRTVPTRSVSASSSNILPEVVTNTPRPAKVDQVQEVINNDSNKRSQIARYVDNQINKAKSNPVSTLTQYGLKYISGKGYEVTSRARDLMLLGLRAGDIIVSINGHSASTPEQDVKLIDEVMASGEILVEYERNGKVLVMKQALLQF